LSILDFDIHFYLLITDTKTQEEPIVVFTTKAQRHKENQQVLISSAKQVYK